MSDDRTAALERQRQHRDDPWSSHQIYLRPCSVRILMVTDAVGSFGQANFGLKALLDALAVPPGPWVRFEVTTAHRGAESTASLQNFRFDRTDLDRFDQIWLFGVANRGDELTEAELRAIARFMDDGGGVFATGDHEDLGVQMCGRVPRVRSMRMWHWPSPGPNGEPVAPKTDGPDRRDTLSAGNDSGVQFDDQSDDVPQRIMPRMYSSAPWNPFWYKQRPHPLLCGPRGVIRVLPDHPHEGECYEPADLSATFTFDGYTTTEYPAGLAPEVIAWSGNGCRIPSDLKGPLNPMQFGAIGTYDGHRVDVGRVVVDATWHHFFNINLIGELGDPGPIKNIGFAATSQGQAAYEDIKSYFRNIAVWLARESTQQCMWWRALWWLRWHHRIAMDVRPYYLDAADRLDLTELLRIGSEARDVLGRVASQCTVRVWTLAYLLRPRFPQIWEKLRPVIDPWHPRPPQPVRPLPQPDPRIVTDLHAEMLLDALLGAAVHAVAARFPVPDDDARKQAEETGIADVAGEHLGHAVNLFTRHVMTGSEELRSLGSVLSEREDRA